MLTLLATSAALLSSPPQWQPCTLVAPAPVVAAATIAGVIGDVGCDYLLAAMFAESSWRVRVTGDSGRAWGLFQIHTRFLRRIVPAWLPVRGGALAQGVAAGLMWRRLIRKFGRERAAVHYACGTRCRAATWTTPKRWRAALGALRAKELREARRY